MADLKIKYGKNLDSSNVPFEAGTLYVDTEKNEISYDDPAGAVTEHQKLSKYLKNILDGEATGSMRTSGTSGYNIGQYAFAEGRNTKAYGNYSHAEGENTETSGESSHAEGYQATASGRYSHAEGWNTTASGGSSHAEGNNTTASGRYSHAEGNDTKAFGYYSHAEGGAVIASGGSSHAEGNGEVRIRTTPEETQQIEVLENGKVLIIPNILEKHGYDCKGIMGIWGSHAPGGGTGLQPSRYDPYQGGKIKITFVDPQDWTNKESFLKQYPYGIWLDVYGVTASGFNSHAEGNKVIASGDNQHVQGKFNIPNSNMAHIVGNGTATDARSNAHTLDWDGNTWYKGHVYSGGTSQADAMDLNQEIANLKTKVLDENITYIFDAGTGAV